MRLFVSDMDGTLLNCDFDISEENIIAIHKLKAQGIDFVIATGRIYMDALTICRRHGLKPYVISNNGACIFAPNGDQLYGKEIFRQDLEDIMHFLKMQELCYGIGSSMAFEVNSDWEEVFDRELVRLHKSGLSVAEKRVQFAKYEMISQNGFKVVEQLSSDSSCYSISVITYDEEAILRLQAFLKSYTNLMCTLAGTHNVEIMRAGGHKGEALAYLCQKLHIDRKDTAVIGDNLNDIHMIENAGIGIAVENARDEVKAVSDYVSKHCLDNGVAHAIDMLLNRQWT